jgi:hypothetical protein
MPAVELYDLICLIDMIHQQLDQLEDGVYGLAGLLGGGVLLGQRNVRSGRQEGCRPLCHEDDHVEGCEADDEGDEDPVQPIASLIKPPEAAPGEQLGVRPGQTKGGF